MQTELSQTLHRQKKVYFPALLVMTLIILLVFAEPTLRRLLAGLWQRGKFKYFYTLSLDFHALFGFVFLFLLLAQVRFGFGQLKKPAWLSHHRRLGRVLLYGFIPLFVVVTCWVVYDRSTNVAPAVSTIFKKHRLSVSSVLFLLLFFISYHFGKAAWSLRKKDIAQHVDSILAGFFVAGGIAIIRFLYLLFWAVRGGSPFSVIGMYLLTAAIVFLALTTCYALGGRLRENKWDLLAFVLANLLLAVLLRNQYTLMDV